jgi:ABC-type lipoprotein export system ATPase subunit
MQVFRIEDLKCGYIHDKLVLSVPFLELEAGKIIVVLGKSGFGKSTFLETLALMNNTIQKGKVLFTPPTLKGEGVFNLQEFWRNGHSELASGLRSNHFSFIFQQTNLMPNFSVFENIFITRMIQGYPEEECREETRKILEKIGLSGIEASRKVTELSGGQRQRVAFARAVISPFDVLFGDEPTGNLDEETSREIMALLADYIHFNGKEDQKTAIIVSHSIDLAIDFADLIVDITWNEALGCGEITRDQVFNRNTEKPKKLWHNEELSFSEADFSNYLRRNFSDKK